MRHYRRHPGTARTQGYFVGILGARGGGNHCRQHDQRIHLQAGAAVVDRQASSGSPAAAGRKGGGVPQCAGTSGQRGREHWCQGGVLRRTRHARSDSGTLRAVVERNRLRPVRELGGFPDRFARRAYRRYAVDLDEPPATESPTNHRWRAFPAIWISISKAITSCWSIRCRPASTKDRVTSPDLSAGSGS